MTITFTLTGNQENPTGNPIPYHRTTQRAWIDQAAKRYYAWKQFVVQEYWLQTAKQVRADKPYDKEVKGRLEAQIHFKGETHADPDNIVKGILDALFENDKHIDVATVHSCGHKEGKVVVTITLI